MRASLAPVVTREIPPYRNCTTGLAVACGSLAYVNCADSVVVLAHAYDDDLVGHNAAQVHPAHLICVASADEFAKLRPFMPESLRLEILKEGLLDGVNIQHLHEHAPLANVDGVAPLARDYSSVHSETTACHC